MLSVKLSKIMEAGYGTLSATLGPDNEDGEAPRNTPSDENLIQSDPSKSQKKYPYSVFFILSNEFCERFSYYGMRAILVLYLTQWLGFQDDRATSIFHAFSMLCYLTPIFGAVIADGYIGRYKTILYLSLVYFVGGLILTVTAVPPPEWYGPAVGLFLIACGTGGIKASVAPFGADQFTAGQEKWQNSFFSAFYFMINLGSLISIILTPILRADVKCFGQDCYILAFGVPAGLMFLSVVLFVSGRKNYKKQPPTGNVIWKTIKCIYYGAVGRICRTRYEEKRSHWLYYADDRFEASFIEDVKQLLNVLTMFLPLPIFWALSDQQGSRWTLQAEHMDGSMGVFGTLKPDQLQALNPLLIIILIPLFDKVVYPLLDLCKVPNRPLQRMVAGLFISSAAFVSAGLVQLKIDNALDPALSGSDTGISFLNTLSCNVTINSDLYSGEIVSHGISDIIKQTEGQYAVGAEATTCSNDTLMTYNAIFTFEKTNTYRIIIYKDDNKVAVKQFYEQRIKPNHGDAAVSVFTTFDVESHTVMLVSEEQKIPFKVGVGVPFKIAQFSATRYKELAPGKYILYIPNKNISNWTNSDFTMTFGAGGVYTVVLDGSIEEPDVTVFEDLQRNSVSVAWMIPQYLLITLGEVLFSISGLSFAYSQAPNSLKSVVQAIWLLTVSCGDLVVIIVANIKAIPNQAAEFILFACLMFIDTVVFMVMTWFYQYKPSSLYQKLEEDSDLMEPVTVTLGENYPLQNRQKD